MSTEEEPLTAVRTLLEVLDYTVIDGRWRARPFIDYAGRWYEITDMYRPNRFLDDEIRVTLMPVIEHSHLVDDEPNLVIILNAHKFYRVRYE